MGLASSSGRRCEFHPCMVLSVPSSSKGPLEIAGDCKSEGCATYWPRKCAAGIAQRTTHENSL